jgi:hypothetical protein
MAQRLRAHPPGRPLQMAAIAIATGLFAALVAATAPHAPDRPSYPSHNPDSAVIGPERPIPLAGS